MKYLIVNSPDGMPAAVMFAECLTHKDVAGEMPVLSAGFCDEHGDVWGGSTSLGRVSRPNDSIHVKLALKMALQPKDKK